MAVEVSGLRGFGVDEQPGQPVSRPPAAAWAITSCSRAAPSRQGRKHVDAYVDADMARQLRVLAAERDTTTQALIVEAIGLLFQAHQPGRVGTSGPPRWSRGPWSIVLPCLVLPRPPRRATACRNAPIRAVPCRAKSARPRLAGPRCGTPCRPTASGPRSVHRRRVAASAEFYQVLAAGASRAACGTMPATLEPGRRIRNPYYWRLPIVGASLSLQLGNFALQLGNVVIQVAHRGT